jgi:prepilin-type N-terminal cleavage/methylation domain-containing protein
MRRINENGLTLVELLVCMAILGIIATAAMPLLSTSLEAYGRGTSRAGLYHEGLLAMERMTSGVRHSTFLLIPNAHNITRDILAFSGLINDDGDYYFNDPLFPKIDEDPGEDMNADGKPGIKDYDDDGDGWVDEFLERKDDDEDIFFMFGGINEDPLDGVDNDGDGNIDEDFGNDTNNDGKPGIAGMDDNANGTIDDGNSKEDDDEDGLKNEDPLNEVIYEFDSGTKTLTESVPSTGESNVLSTRVNLFQVKYQSPGLIEIKLQLTGDNNEIVEFKEFVYSRNTFQKTGKRVR